MSFGLYDKDWVDLDPPHIIKCKDCEYWNPCPYCCEARWCGWCGERFEFTDSDDECEE